MFNKPLNVKIPTIQNVFHGEIKLLFSVQHQKQLLSELVLLEGYITFTNFQFKPLPINIIHHTHISSSRDKNEAKRHWINFSFNFIFIIEQTMSIKSALEHIIIGQSSPGPHYFFVGNISPDFQMPQNPIIFLNYFCRKTFLWTTASHHVIFG